LSYSTDISIIIPCYNSQDTLEDTLDSIANQDFGNWEALIINDGSSDDLEPIATKWVSKDNRFKYFKKENGGLGSARNYGIAKAKGRYILPLDSDNKLAKDFLSKGFKILETNETVGVVYGNAILFGEQNGNWRVGEFDRYKMLYHNYIDACAIIRKKVFDQVGLYDESLPHQGHEDWEFWLRVMKSDFKFYYLDEITFYYRVSSTSMIKSFKNEMLQENIRYIQCKHYELYIDKYKTLFKENELLKKELSRSVVKRILNKLKNF